MGNNSSSSTISSTDNSKKLSPKWQRLTPEELQQLESSYQKISISEPIKEGPSYIITSNHPPKIRNTGPTATTTVLSSSSSSSSALPESTTLPTTITSMPSFTTSSSKFFPTKEELFIKAIKNQNWEQIRYFIRRNIGKSYSNPETGFTLLHYFIFHRTYLTAVKDSDIEEFIRFQAHHINQQDLLRKATVLHFAIWYIEDNDSKRITRLLLKYGADRTIQDVDHLAAIDYAKDYQIFGKKTSSSFLVESSSPPSFSPSSPAKEAINDENSNSNNKTNSSDVEDAETVRCSSPEASLDD